MTGSRKNYIGHNPADAAKMGSDRNRLIHKDWAKVKENVMEK